jgi:hypothetical protein
MVRDLSPESRRSSRQPRDVGRKRRLSFDLLFSGLDGRRIAAGDSTWSIEVYGVHESATARWVQLVLVGGPSHVLAMRLPLKQTVDSALTAITAWLRTTSGCGIDDSGDWEGDGLRPIISPIGFH